jgi:squalene-hopene/tetraprenyl-beta-curcumene cyclase
LVSRQTPSGAWLAHLQAGSPVEADWILLQLWWHPPAESRWQLPDRRPLDLAAEALLARQLPEGGFGLSPAGPVDLSISVRAYAALKLAGLSADDPRLARLRDEIRARGGVHAADGFTRILLAALGLYSRAACPAVPPVALWFRGFLGRLSVPAQAFAVPLAVLQASGVERPAPGFDLRELEVGAPPAAPALLPFDALGRWWARLAPAGVQREALVRCGHWLAQHLTAPGTNVAHGILSILALESSPLAAAARPALAALRDALTFAGPGAFTLRPAGIRQTARAVHALAISGAAASEAQARAVKWLQSQARPAWPSELGAGFPGVDETAMALRAANQPPAADNAAVEWLLAAQARNGGWSAFAGPSRPGTLWPGDPAPDVTGRVLEALVHAGLDPAQAALQRAVKYLIQAQERDGSWRGSRGVAYLHGTCFALRGLQAAGVSDREAYVLRGGEWLRSLQNADGGWGESGASFDRGEYAPAPSTPSQTAWAMLGLIASGDTTSSSLHHGAEHLCATQLPDGGWRDSAPVARGVWDGFWFDPLAPQADAVFALAEYQRSQENEAG